MSDTSSTIGELTVATSLSSTDKIEIERAGVSYSGTLSLIPMNITTSSTTNLTGLIYGNGSSISKISVPTGLVLGNGTTLSGVTVPTGIVLGDGSTLSGVTVPTGIVLGDGSTLSGTAIPTGLLLGNGTTITAGTAGTDYAKPNTKSSWSKQQSGYQFTLSSTSNHIATNCDNGNNFVHTMTENTTLDNPTNIVAGTYYAWTFIQNAGSAKTLSFGTYFKNADGTAFPAMSTTLSAVNTLFAYAETTTSLVCNFVKKGIA